jgi:hypothetical protein
MYGAAFDKWIEQRNKIMSPDAMKIFNTQSSERLRARYNITTVLNRLKTNYAFMKRRAILLVFIHCHNIHFYISLYSVSS